MFDIKFTPTSEKDLKKITKDLRKRIIKKLRFFASQEDPIIFASPLVNIPPATHRFRIGHYRISFYIQSTTIYILRIRHRREIYQS